MQHTGETNLPPTLFLNADDIDRAFSWKEAITTLRAAYGAEVTDTMFPPRTMARGKGVWLRALSGVSPDGRYMGAKLIAVNTGIPAGNLLISLFDQKTAALAAQMDAHPITGYRTAATTALALDALSRPGAVRVGVLGTGFEAQNHVRALAAVRQIAGIVVFSPNPESRAKFAQAVADLGAQVTSVASSAEVLGAGVDIVICAARSRNEEPVFDGALLKPGMTVASIGSTLPEQREIDPETVARSSVIVADMAHEVADDTGDMRAADAAKVPFRDKLVPLADVIAGRHAGRTSDDQIVMYKSVGAAIQDIAVAVMCLDRARELGLGVAGPLISRPYRK